MSNQDAKLYGKIAIMALLDLARCDSRLTAHDVIALQALGSKVDSKTVSFRTQSSIAKEMRLSHTAIGKKIRKLETIGYIKKVKNTKSQYKNRYNYFFSVEMIPKYHGDLVAFGEMTETLKGFNAKKPHTVSKIATLRGCTKKYQKNNKKYDGYAGGEHIGDLAIKSLNDMFGTVSP